MYMQRMAHFPHYDYWECHPCTPIHTPPLTDPGTIEDGGSAIIHMPQASHTPLAIKETMLASLRARYPDIVPTDGTDGQGGFGRVYHQILDLGNKYIALVFAEPHLQYYYKGVWIEGCSIPMAPVPSAVGAFLDYVRAHRVGYCTEWSTAELLVAENGAGWLHRKRVLQGSVSLTVYRVIYDLQTYQNQLAGREKQARTQRKKRLKQALIAAVLDLTPEELGEVLLEVFGSRL